jgi:protease-4
MSLFKRSNNRIAVVKIEGIISDNDSIGAGRAKIMASLKEAERRKARAIILRVNSPGGSVAACQEVFALVSKIKEKGTPVVASMGDVAASGGVYVSMAASEVFASPGTVTGSIGVIIRSSNFSTLYQKVGVAPKVIKSGPHKDMLSTYREFSEDERNLLQGVINDTHSQFVDTVAASRNKPFDDIAQIADGRIMTGRQAKEAGLVDSLGGLDAAIERAARLAAIPGKPQIFVIQPRKSFWQRLLSPVTALGQKATGGTLCGIPLWLMPTF